MRTSEQWLYSGMVQRKPDFSHAPRLPGRRQGLADPRNACFFGRKASGIADCAAMRSADYAWLRSGLEVVEDALLLEADVNWRARGLLIKLRRILDHIAAEQARTEQRELHGWTIVLDTPSGTEQLALIVTAYTRLANAVIRRWSLVRRNHPAAVLPDSGEETFAIFHTLLSTQLAFLVSRSRQEEALNALGIRDSGSRRLQRRNRLHLDGAPEGRLQIALT